jgi:hypothetical protein
LLSFVESAPRAYRPKVGNADLFRNSTEPGTSPGNEDTGDCQPVRNFMRQERSG